MFRFPVVPHDRPGTPLAFLAVLLWLGATCGPVGTRNVTAGKTDAGEEGTGGSDESGGTGGRQTPDARQNTGGSSGGTGGLGTGGAGTGGAGTGGAGTGGATGGMGGRDAATELMPDTAPPPPDAPSTCYTGMPGVFMNNPMTSKTGKFTARFSVTASASPTNGIIAFSMGPQTGFAGYAASVRFNPMGSIDAVNGGAYGSASNIPYTANTTYHFRMAIDVAAHTYSAWVTPAGGNETLIGTGYGFRTGQTGINALDSWGVVMQSAATGTIKACGFIVE